MFKMNMRRLLGAVSLEPCNINKWWLAIIISVWSLAIFAGGYLALDHAWKPGQVSLFTEKKWPDSSSLKASSKSKTVLLFVHPKCPCTNASLIELRNLIERTARQDDIKIAFYVPENFSDEWIEEDKLILANAVPGAEIIYDFDGREMRTFGAVTSGQCYIFSPEKELLFSGGITAGRGHVGKNPGSDTCLNILANADFENEYRKLPVFGCPMEQPK